MLLTLYIGGHTSSKGESDKDGCKDGQCAGENLGIGEEPETATRVPGNKHSKSSNQHANSAEQC